MRSLAIIPLFAFLLLACLLGIYLWQLGSGEKNTFQLPSALINKPIPEFKLPPIKNMEAQTKGLKTSDLKGKVALVNIWASWCPPCQAEHPILMNLADEGVKIYGINYRDTPRDARIFLEMLGNPYTKIGADIQGRVAIEWGVYGYPETFVVDQTGRIRYRHVGPINPGQLNSVIRPILNKVSR